MDKAAANGHLEVVKWLHANSSEGCTSGAMDGAAANGHLEVVQWLHMNRSEGRIVSAINNVVIGEQQVIVHHGNANTQCRDKQAIADRDEKCFAIIKWLHATRPEGYKPILNSTIVDGAAANGYLEMLKWFHDNTKARCTTKAMNEAAARGWLDVVEWLHVNRSEGCTPRAMDEAARNGHLDVVKWLQTNRSEGGWGNEMNDAAGNGHLGVVKLLQKKRCVHEKDAEAAAEAGHFRVVRWLLANSVGVDTLLALRKAVLSRHFEVALFLYSQHGSAYSDTVVSEWKNDLHFSSKWRRTIIRVWLEEKFPSFISP